MTLPTFSTGTRPLAALSFVTLVNDEWTELWGADLARTFAAVVGGTGVEGDTVYVTHDSGLDPGDPGVAEFQGVRGALYLETRGTSPLYARTNLDDPLIVRTTTTVQVDKVPQPAGLIGTKNYRVTTVCGGGAVTYLGADSDVYANILADDETRLRTVLLGDSDIVMIAQRLPDPSIIALLTPSVFQSSGPAFPGPLFIEGPEGVQVINLGDVGLFGAVWYVSDHKEPI